LAPDLVKVGQRGVAPVPKFVGGFLSQHWSRGEVCQICCSDTKLIPEGGRCLAGKVHCPSLPKDCPMDAFSTTILCRCIGGGHKVIDS